MAERNNMDQAPDKKDIKKWIKALRSGKFKQSKGCLEDQFGNCCLGVACRVFIPKKDLLFQVDSKHMTGAMPGSQPKVPNWLRNVNEDFMDRTGTALVALNDSGVTDTYQTNPFSFDEIADLLQLVYIEEAL